MITQTPQEAMNPLDKLSSEVAAEVSDLVRQAQALEEKVYELMKLARAIEEGRVQVIYLEGECGKGEIG